MQAEPRPVIIPAMTTIRAQLIGYPRIGPNRELKRALERAWSGRMDREAFEGRVAELRRSHLDEQREAIGSAVDDFFLYDEVLETALMLGICRGAEADLLRTDPFAALTALARGTPEREAWEMTKWFDTNYHYVVPEITAPVTTFQPLPWREPMGDTTWVVIAVWDLSRREDLSRGKAIIWMAVILVIPFLGVIAYYLFGRSTIPVWQRWTFLAGGMAVYLLFLALGMVVGGIV
jgi:hypothetical protein